MGATSPDMGVELSQLPFHPTTGLQALDIISGKPVWPVMGGSEDAGSAGGDGSAGAGQQSPAGQGSQQQNGGQSDQGQQSGGADKGFPENTPVKEMTTEQQAAYYRYQNRQTDNKLAAFKGVTPQQVQELQTELEGLREKSLSADQKAIKDAEKAARAAADADWLPKLQTAQLRAIASDVLKGDQLEAWLSGMNPAAFAGETGEIDQEKVIGHLTAAFGGSDQGQGQQSNGQRQAPAWGQQSGGTGAPSRPGEAGKAAAIRRHNLQSSN
jgi:hypothetical protein